MIYYTENNNCFLLIEKYISKYPDKKWNIEYLIKNNKINGFKALSRFKNYPNKLWDWNWLIQNTNIHVERYIPFNIIEKYLYKWNYFYLSKNPNLTEKFILKYPYQNWDIKYLIENNKITNFNNLSKFKYINWKWIIENIDIYVKRYIPSNLIEKYKRDYLHLSYNSNLTEDFNLKYLYQDWDIEYLSKKVIFKKFFYKFK